MHFELISYWLSHIIIFPQGLGNIQVHISNGTHFRQESWEGGGGGILRISKPKFNTGRFKNGLFLSAFSMEILYKSITTG